MCIYLVIRKWLNIHLFCIHDKIETLYSEFSLKMGVNAEDFCDYPYVLPLKIIHKSLENGGAVEGIPLIKCLQFQRQNYFS